MLLAVASCLAYDQSLRDCKAVAEKFSNTCAHGDYDTPAVSVAGMPSQPFTCADKPRCIPSGTSSGRSCTWQRKLCVTCSISSGTTKIRVQTNNLPNHWRAAKDQTPRSTPAGPQGIRYDLCRRSISRCSQHPVR